MGGGQLLVLEKKRRRRRRRRRRRKWWWWFGHREVRRARGGEGGEYVGLSVYIYQINSLLCAGLRVGDVGGKG